MPIPTCPGTTGPTATATSGWSLAANLDCRRDGVWQLYPNMTIYTVGDTSHQAQPSDHNPDARTIVHALDCMSYSDTATGQSVCDWALADTTDLEYVIFNRKIYTRSGGWRPENYSGSDPHTDHVHISGKHGGTGYSPNTGTGYDTTAEAYRPAGMGDEMAPTAQENANTLLGTWLGKSGPNVGVALQSTYNMVSAMNNLNATMATTERTGRKLVAVGAIIAVILLVGLALAAYGLTR